MKKIFCVLLAFLLVVCGTVAFDILKEDREQYAESPYRHFYADSANAGKVLSYQDLFFVSSFAEPVYTVGSNGISKEQMDRIDALDEKAENDNNSTIIVSDDAPFYSPTTVIEEPDIPMVTEDQTNAEEDDAAEMQGALRIYKRADFVAFQKLLQRMTFRPVEGFKNALLGRLFQKRNGIATFQLNSRYYSANTEPYQDIIGVVPEYTASIADQKNRIEGGNIFLFCGRVYLDAWLVSRSEYDEALKMEVPAVWDEYKTVFEILPSDALNELLAQREFYASGIGTWETIMGPSLRISILKETKVFVVILLLVILYEIGRKKHWWKKQKPNAQA